MPDGSSTSPAALMSAPRMTGAPVRRSSQTAKLFVPSVATAGAGCAATAGCRGASVSGYSRLMSSVCAVSGATRSRAIRSERMLFVLYGCVLRAVHDSAVLGVDEQLLLRAGAIHPVDAAPHELDIPVLPRVRRLLPPSFLDLPGAGGDAHVAAQLAVAADGGDLRLAVFRPGEHLHRHR